MWIIPDDNDEIPEDLWGIEVFVEKHSYQPAEPDVGIMNGYYEQIFLTLEKDNPLTDLLNENEEYIAERYDEELQECDESEPEPDMPNDEPEYNFEATQTAGWWK